MRYSAGILLYRKVQVGYEVLLIHPGGPFWAKKDQGAWSMPKGEYQEDEKPLAAAKREFEEEVGSSAPEGEYDELGEAKQANGKVVKAYCLEFDFDLGNFKSNVFEVEWPPKSGKKQQFPENDKAAWVSLAEAKAKLVKGQAQFVETLAANLGEELNEPQPGSTPQASLF